MYVCVCVCVCTHTNICIYICGCGQGKDTILNLTILTYFEIRHFFKLPFWLYKYCYEGMPAQVSRPSLPALLFHRDPQHRLGCSSGLKNLPGPHPGVHTFPSPFLNPAPSLLSCMADPPRPLLRPAHHQSSSPQQSAQLWQPCSCCPGLSGAAHFPL